MDEIKAVQAAQPPADSAYIKDSEAEYTLEYPASCPACRSSIKTVWAIRLLRTRVNFTSTLPRHGRALVCPSCQAVLSATLNLA